MSDQAMPPTSNSMPEPEEESPALAELRQTLKEVGWEELPPDPNEDRTKWRSSSCPSSRQKPRARPRKRRRLATQRNPARGSENDLHLLFRRKRTDGFAKTRKRGWR
jgi:hypothetical protein